jgi:hypothetical protein
LMRSSGHCSTVRTAFASVDSLDMMFSLNPCRIGCCVF